MASPIEKSQFSVYDFMGYIVPGMFFSTMIFIVYMGIGRRSSTVRYLLELFERISNGTFSTTLIDFAILGFASIFLLVVFYLVGHLIATISHLTIDRVLVFSLLKYPFIRKLHLTDKNDYFIMFIHALIWSFLVFSYWFLLIYLLFELMLMMQLSLIFLLISLSITAVRVFVIPMFPKESDDQLVSESSLLGRISKWFFLKLSQFFINPMIKLLFIDRGFQPEFINEVKQRYKDTFNLDMAPYDTNVYWMMHNYVVSHSTIFEKYKNNWLRLYGLCRNIAMASSLICGLQLILTFKYDHVISGIPNLQVCFLCAVMAPIFLFRYFVLFYNYLTKNVIRCFYLLTTPSCNPSTPAGYTTGTFSIPSWTSVSADQSEPE